MIILCPAYQTSHVTIYQGDALDVLRELPSESVHCCVTSPPYWGLRDYGIDGQLGLEKTPEEYVGKMVEVFREVKRVLRKDGTCWVNMGDGYANSGNQVTGYNEPDWIKTGGRCEGGKRTIVGRTCLKPKDLIGMPWRLAFALQADGWWLRPDIIWAKSNPMPESVTDRPTKAHEYVFLLTKSASYFYDQEAVRESLQESTLERGYSYKDKEHYRSAKYDKPPSGVSPEMGKRYIPAGRNLRSVWTFATQPFPEAHFATFPEELARRCILAGTSGRGQP